MLSLLNHRAGARWISFAVFCCVVWTMQFPVASANENEDLDTVRAWQHVRQGTAVILMRHAIAPGTGDPAEFDIKDCTTQRNLSEEGRAQAGRIGEVLRSKGLDSAMVISSQWCRCVETAELLGLGAPTTDPMLNSFFSDRSTEPEQTAALKESLLNWVKDWEMRVLVTHQVNISAISDQYTSSGEMLIVGIVDGEVTVLASIQTE